MTTGPNVFADDELNRFDAPYDDVYDDDGKLLEVTPSIDEILAAEG